ncbi:MAG: rod shape-determining protein MreD [Coriobacteriales bacterium]|jgi:rod shape-determining protein MreD|nr:rod shape-determining protein MreD [Coriobacteriales bacterium]
MMEMERETQATRLSFTMVGGLIAFLLQLIIAPNIAILGAVPNFILCFVVLNAMSCGTIRSSLAGFILGLLYDLVAQGPLGIMSFVLAILGYAVSSLNKELFAGSWAVQALFLFIAAFFGELLHAAFLSILGYDSDFLLSLGMRVVPGTLYDALFGLIVFPLIQRFGERHARDSRLLKGKFD